MLRTHSLIAVLLLCAVSLPARGAQQPARIDISAIGPQVGAQVPPFSGVDQFGRPQSLESSLGPKGAMLVFFRSADW